MKRAALPALVLLCLSPAAQAEPPPPAEPPPAEEVLPAEEPEAPASEEAAMPEEAAPVPEAPPADAPPPPPDSGYAMSAGPAPGHSAAPDGAHADEEMVCRRGACGPDRPRRFAVGIAGGHIDLDEAGEGRQKSIIGRVMLRYGFAVELELSRAELDDDGGTAKTGGVALEKFFCTHRRLNPYLAAGTGGGRIEREDGSDARMGYGELGGGLMLRGRRFALALDWRAGVRRSEASAAIDAGVAAAMTSPSDDDDDWERDRYHRARLMLLFQF